MKRRAFLRAGTLAGVGGGLWMYHQQASAAPATDELQVAVIGAGTQGKLLLSATTSIPNVRFRAISDIWKYARDYGRRYLSRHGQDVNLYVDYREMLDKEKDLDAVLIATPDFVHAEQTNACLDAGLHVYCEPMIAHTINAGKSMVAAMQRSGRLLQIGYQRRSNPRYRHVFEKLLVDANLPDRLTAVQTQWAMPEADLRGFPRKFPIADKVLQRFGYRNMQEFRNWNWYPKYSGGPFCSFVAQQLDVVHWFLDAVPETVMAVGTNDFYADRFWFDTVMATYQFPGIDGPILTSCNLFTNSSAGGTRLFERFLGTAASIQISENPRWMKICREANADEWDQWIRKRYLVEPESKLTSSQDDDATDVHVSGEVEEYQLPVVMEKSGCQPHLENFFDAIRGQAELNCPADIAFRSQVTSLKTLDAIQLKKLLVFDEAEFSL